MYSPHFFQWHSCFFEALSLNLKQDITIERSIVVRCAVFSWLNASGVCVKRLLTASLHQAMRSTGCASPYESRWSAVIGAFLSSSFRCEVVSREARFKVVPSAVPCSWQMFLLLRDDWWFGHEALGPVVQTLNNTVFYWLRVVRIIRQVLVSVSWFPVDAGGKAAAQFSRNWRVKKGDLALFLGFHGKADGGLLKEKRVYIRGCL